MKILGIVGSNRNKEKRQGDVSSHREHRGQASQLHIFFFYFYFPFCEFVKPDPGSFSTPDLFQMYLTQANTGQKCLQIL